LESANAQLQEYAVTVEELAIARGRNRFAGVVHDSVGHTMTVLIS
jgi:signal transduction histidine kinase